MPALEDQLEAATEAHRAGDLVSAARQYSSVLEADPRHAPALHQFGVLCQQLGKHRDAAELIARACELAEPEQLAEYRTNLVTTLLSLGKYQLALDHCREIEGAGALSPALALNKSTALRNLGQHAEAMRDLTRVCQTHDHYPALWCALGNACQESGDVAAARSAYERALALDPEDTATLLNLTRLMVDRGELIDDRWIKGLIAAVDRSDDLEDRIRLLFALASGLDRQGQFDDAFEMYSHANEQRRIELQLKDVEFDRSCFVEQVSERIAYFGRERIGRFAESGSDSPLPVFIVGMPRSGTTLLEQILIRHPDLASVGERDEVDVLFHEMLAASPEPRQGIRALDGLPPELWSAAAAAYIKVIAERTGTARRVINKLPANLLHVGFIASLFPHSRIVHCVRDRRDVMVSCFCQHFTASRVAAFSSSFADLDCYERQARRLSAHWQKSLGPAQFYTVTYEQLVAEPAEVCQELFTWLGVAWDEQLLEQHDDSSVVRTASVNQVRERIHQRSIGKWQRFGRCLAQTVPEIDWKM